jgi:hypothetical protein
MAAFIILEFLLTLILGLVMYTFALVPAHNAIMSGLMNAGLVMSLRNYQVADVIAWAIIGMPMLLIILAAIYAYNKITYRTGG